MSSLQEVKYLLLNNLHFVMWEINVNTVFVSPPPPSHPMVSLFKSLSGCCKKWYLIFGLFVDKGATYEFRVKARNEVGLGERASAVIITPDGGTEHIARHCQDLCFQCSCFIYIVHLGPLLNFFQTFVVPAGAPQNFSAESLSETSVLLEWDLPAKHLQNGEIIMYQVLYDKLADNTEEDLNVTGLQYEIKGLEMNTDYVFQIRAFTSMGPGPWSPRHLHHTFGRSKASDIWWFLTPLAFLELLYTCFNILVHWCNHKLE